MLNRRPRTTATAHWGWASAGAAFGLLLTVLAAAPAHWLASAVHSASGEQVLLADARGTVWDGSAQLVFTGGAGSADAAALPSRLVWRLRPVWRGAGPGVHIGLSAACCTPAPLALQALPHWGGVRVLVADAINDGAGNGVGATPASVSYWPAALSAGLGAPWNTLQLEGEVALTTQALSFDWNQGRLTLQGQATLEARRIASRLSTLKPMGSYRFNLQGGAVPSLLLETLDGSLNLSGSGRWVAGKLRFEGNASAAPEREAALANLLNIIGRRNGPRSVITVG
jgi:general secretion pathway protein N